MPTHSALGALARACFGTSSRVERIQSAASSELSPSRSNEGLDASELSKLAVRSSEPDACEGEGDGELSSPLRRRPTTSATSASACRRRARARSAALSSLAAARRSNASRRASSVGALARTLACAMQRRSECETRRVAWTCAKATSPRSRCWPIEASVAAPYSLQMYREHGREAAESGERIGNRECDRPPHDPQTPAPRAARRRASGLTVVVAITAWPPRRPPPCGRS